MSRKIEKSEKSTARYRSVFLDLVPLGYNAVLIREEISEDEVVGF